MTALDIKTLAYIRNVSLFISFLVLRLPG